MRDRSVRPFSAGYGTEVPKSLYFGRSGRKLIEKRIICNNYRVFPRSETAERVICLLEAVLRVKVGPLLKGLHRFYGIQRRGRHGVIVIVLPFLKQEHSKGMSGLSSGRYIIRRENKSHRHIVPLESREHIPQLLPCLRGRIVSELRQDIGAVEHHGERLAHREAVAAAVVGILGHGIFLEAPLYLLKAVKLRHVHQQVTGGKVHGELSPEEQRRVRPFSRKRSLHHSAGDKIYGNRYAGLRHEAVLRHFLYHLRLIPSESYPYL